MIYTHEDIESIKKYTEQFINEWKSNDSLQRKVSKDMVQLLDNSLFAFNKLLA